MSVRVVKKSQSGFGACNVDEGLTIGGRIGVDVEERADALTDFVGNACDDHSPIGVAAQDRIGDALIHEDVDDVLHVRVQVDRTIGQAGAFSDPGQRRRVDLVPRLAKHTGDPCVNSAALESAMYENEFRHLHFVLLLKRSGNTVSPIVITMSCNPRSRAPVRRRLGSET